MAESAFCQEKYWVFFKDKPDAESFLQSGKDQNAEHFLLRSGILTRRAIERRLKVLPESKVVSASDFPVYTPYLDSLKKVGLHMVGTSRWLDAAVVSADPAAVSKAEGFPFVIAIKKVLSFNVETVHQKESPFPFGPVEASSSSVPQADSALYGPSFVQLEVSGIPQIQALGIDGEGVLIGMLDTGFRYETHEALQHVKIVGEHDFIQHDSITENQAGDAPVQDNHGTSTLSVLGGYSPGNLIGVAYGAKFMLAKTEYVPVTDFKWEEDNWVEGLEWMESRGVDVVSSSVAYDIFVDSSGAIDSAQSYFWSRGNFNGKTAESSIAASEAARLGVIVVQAMGNEGNGNGKVGTLLVPADADSIISVGAVDANGNLAGFSSTGPTNDGRTKPDLVADGVNNYVAVVPGPDTYAYESGTSFATPITAGVAALILSVRPDYTPMEVIDLLKRTAVENQPGSGDSLTSTYPNDFYGYGIVNAWNAVKSIGFVGSNDFTFWQKDGMVYLAVRAYSTTGINLGLSKAYYSTDSIHYHSARVFQTDTLSQLAFSVFPPATTTGRLYFYFDLVDSAGKRLEVPYYGQQSPFGLPDWIVAPPSFAGSFMLLNNYPNPFSRETHIGIILKNGSNVKVDVFDVLGRKVKSVFDGPMSSGYQMFVWDGSTDHSRLAGSGVYFIKVDVDGSIKILKVLYLK